MYKYRVMAEADDATNELIARILAADNDQGYGFDEVGAGDASDDSDYGGPARKKSKRGRSLPQQYCTGHEGA